MLMKRESQHLWGFTHLAEDYMFKGIADQVYEELERERGEGKEFWRKGRDRSMWKPHGNEGKQQ